jgi:hypothetical protein
LKAVVNFSTALLPVAVIKLSIVTELKSIPIPGGAVEDLEGTNLSANSGNSTADENPGALVSRSTRIE